MGAAVEAEAEVAVAVAASEASRAGSPRVGSPHLPYAVLRHRALTADPRKAAHEGMCGRGAAR